MSVHRSYVPASGCAGGPAPGAKALVSWYLARYKALGGRNGGIYNCRRIAGTNVWSLHAEGRAGDLMVPPGNPWSQDLADWLVAHSHELRIQCVIHRRRIWSGSYPDAGWRPYRGGNPHDDHLHVELDPRGAANLTVAGIEAVRAGSNTWTEEAVDNLPTLRRVTSGPARQAVRNMQHLVEAHGVSVGRQGCDGRFGRDTQGAVKEFQAQRKIARDGVCGPVTWGELLDVR